MCDGEGGDRPDQRPESTDEQEQSQNEEEVIDPEEDVFSPENEVGAREPAGRTGSGAQIRQPDGNRTAVAAESRPTLRYRLPTARSRPRRPTATAAP